MRTQRGRTVKVSPVDDDGGQVVHDLPERGRIEALFDQNLFRMHIRRERSSAYWFAAALWGVSGLVIGAFLGAFLSMKSAEFASPVTQDALTRGMAIEAARNRVDSRPPLQLENQGQQQPQDNR